MPKIFVVISIALVLWACQTTQSLNELKIKSSPVIASFTIKSESSSNKLHIFGSPSCNHCELMLLDVIDAKLRNSSLFAKTDITFSFIPRKELDVRIISGFMCLPRKDRPAAMVNYYRSINLSIDTKAITDAIALAEYKNVMAAHGISEKRREICESDPRLRSMIAAVYMVGDSYRDKNEVPVVVNNEKYLGVIRYWQLKEKLE